MDERQVECHLPEYLAEKHEKSSKCKMVGPELSKQLPRTELLFCRSETSFSTLRKLMGNLFGRPLPTVRLCVFFCFLMSTSLGGVHFL